MHSSTIARLANRDSAERLGELRFDTPLVVMEATAPVTLCTPAAAVAGAAAGLGAVGVGFGIDEAID